MINECSNCYLWEPVNPSHLCLDGACYLDPKNPEPKTRHDICDEYEEEGDV